VRPHARFRLFFLTTELAFVTSVLSLVGCAATPSRKESVVSALVQVQVLQFSVDDPTAPIPMHVIPGCEDSQRTGLLPQESISNLRKAVESMPGYRSIADATLFDVPRLGQTVLLHGDRPNKSGELLPGHSLEVTVYGNDVHPRQPVLMEVKWWSPAEDPGSTQLVSLPGAVFLRPDEAIVMRSRPGPRWSTAIAVITAQSLGNDGRVFQAEVPRR